MSEQNRIDSLTVAHKRHKKTNQKKAHGRPEPDRSERRGNVPPRNPPLLSPESCVSLKLNSERFASQGHCSSLSQAFSVATHTAVLPCGANKRKTEQNVQILYLFAVSVVIAVVWVDSCPWRYGEQHFSRRYVRSGEHSPGCQLTSASGEVGAGVPLLDC